MMTAESRLIALLKPKVYVLLLYRKKKKKKSNMGAKELFCSIDAGLIFSSLYTVPLLQE